jgi:hypothetical protein
LTGAARKAAVVTKDETVEKLSFGSTDIDSLARFLVLRFFGNVGQESAPAYRAIKHGAFPSIDGKC